MESTRHQGRRGIIMRMIECSACGKEYEHKLLDDNPTCPECTEPYFANKENSNA